MTKMMKAAVLKAAKEMVVEEIAVPVPAEGEVLIKVSANGLCHTDLTYYEGHVKVNYPLVLGHEAAGVVAAVKGDGAGLVEGDCVLLPPVYGCGECAFCLRGDDNLCPQGVMLGGQRDGAYAQYLTLPARYAFKMKKGLDLTRACVAADAVATVYFALKERVAVKPGDGVAVFGAGGLGLAALAVAKALGAEKLVAVDVKEGALELASKIGAEAVNAAGQEKVYKTLKKMTGDGIRVAIDCVGMGQTISEAFQTVQKGGDVAVIGFTLDTVQLKAGAFMGMQKRIGGSWGCPTRLFPEVIGLLEAGKIPLDLLVSRIYPLADIQTAFDDLHKGRVTGRAVIEIPQD
ncbi:MAG: alcohol dehydrogenase catalytic domain-containing protein [Planctomycetes bacterium]|nr:alcohol dehydrogenase catalytic domain-containing protein [Planctomycetota bacterium]